SRVSKGSQDKPTNSPAAVDQPRHTVGQRICTTARAEVGHYSAPPQKSVHGNVSLGRRKAHHPAFVIHTESLAKSSAQSTQVCECVPKGRPGLFGALLLCTRRKVSY